MPTIQALQAKAEEAMGKNFPQKEKSEHENESDSEDEYSNESSGRDDNCAGNADENDVSTSECDFSPLHAFLDIYVLLLFFLLVCLLLFMTRIYSFH